VPVSVAVSVSVSVSDTYACAYATIVNTHGHCNSSHMYIHTLTCTHINNHKFIRAHIYAYTDLLCNNSE